MNNLKVSTIVSLELQKEQQNTKYQKQKPINI